MCEKKFILFDICRDITGHLLGEFFYLIFPVSDQSFFHVFFNNQGLKMVLYQINILILFEFSMLLFQLISPTLMIVEEKKTKLYYRANPNLKPTSGNLRDNIVLMRNTNQ